MDVFTQIVDKIVTEQEAIIGPVAREQANKVPGLKVGDNNHEISITGDKKIILENLVSQYGKLFGRSSIEVCREAVRDIISQVPKEQIPQLLL
jgi:hypothetical protein